MALGTASEDAAHAGPPGPIPRPPPALGPAAPRGGASDAPGCTAVPTAHGAACAAPRFGSRLYRRGSARPDGAGAAGGRDAGGHVVRLRPRAAPDVYAPSAAPVRRSRLRFAQRTKGRANRICSKPRPAPAPVKEPQGVVRYRHGALSITHGRCERRDGDYHFSRGPDQLHEHHPRVVIRRRPTSPPNRPAARHSYRATPAIPPAASAMPLRPRPTRNARRPPRPPSGPAYWQDPGPPHAPRFAVMRASRRRGPLAAGSRRATRRRRRSGAGADSSGAFVSGMP